jgi:uncharacterized short protein YbdD (DUF466 family)
MASATIPSTIRRLPARGLAALRQRFARIVCCTWRGIREWCGDAAYERYLRAKRRQREPGRVLTPEEFYVEQLERRYSRPNRCC